MRRRVSGWIFLALAAAALLCAPGALPARAEPGWYVGPWGLTYARYAPGLFGPDKPLRALLEEYRIPLDAGGRPGGARLLVIKDGRRCELWIGERMIKAYRVQLSQRSRGAKTRRRDQRTPEGDYAVCAHRPSKYYRGLWINYPNLEDAERGATGRLIDDTQRAGIADALARGECPPQDTRLGGLIMLHGQQRSLTRSSQGTRATRARPDLTPGDADPGKMREYHDWTVGCVAMFNPDIRELYDLLPDGTPIRIVAAGQPTRPAPPR